jgi:hypothetical protein
LQPLIAIFEDSRTPIEGLLNVLSAVSPTFELLRGVVEAALPPIQSIVESVFGIVGGLISEHGDTMLADMTEAWTGIQAIIDGILPPIQSVVETVLGAVAAFLAEHGDEIQAVLAKAWDTIALVVDAALKLINATIVPAFQYIASFLSAHSTEIQQILGGAWDIISGTIDAVLTTIQGIITAATQAIQGDWSGAWETIKQTADQVWADIQQALEGAWAIIEGLITTAIDGIIGPILGMPDQVAGTGAAIVQEIWDGIKAKWDELVKWFEGKLQELRDQLPFSEPKDPSSPLYGLGESGAAIIDMILRGMVGRGSALADTMAEIGEGGIVGMIASIEGAMPTLDAAVAGMVGQIDARLQELRASLEDAGGETRAAIQAEIALLEDQMHALVSAAEKLPVLMAAAQEELFGVAASVARQQERNLANLDDFSTRQQASIQAELAAAEAAAALIPDPAEANEFFKLRSKQIFELAELEKQQAEAGMEERTKLEADHARSREGFAKRQKDLDADLAKTNNDEANKLADLHARLAGATPEQAADIQKQIEAVKAAAAEKRASILEEIDLNVQAKNAELLAFNAAIAKNDELANAERIRLQQRIELVRQAQAAEQEALKLHQENTQSVFEQMAAGVQALLASIPDGVALPENWVTALQTFQSMLTEFNRLYDRPPPTPWLPPAPGNNAGGTDFWRGGWSWVGEEGPELLRLPRGAQVLPTPALGALMAGRAGLAPISNQTLVFNIDARGSQMTRDEFKRIVREEVNTQANAAEGRRRTK